jgi:hypothetical protein
MPEEEKERCIHALRCGSASASAMPECVTKYHGKSLLEADRLLVKGNFSAADYTRMEEKRKEATQCITMLNDVVEKCVDVQERIMTETFNKFLEKRCDERFVCPLSSKIIDTPIRISCGCTVDSEQFVAYLRECEEKKTLACCPVTWKSLENFEYSHDGVMQAAKCEWIKTEKELFLRKINLDHLNGFRA